MRITMAVCPGIALSLQTSVLCVDSIWWTPYTSRTCLHIIRPMLSKQGISTLGIRATVDGALCPMCRRSGTATILLIELYHTLDCALVALDGGAGVAKAVPSLVRQTTHGVRVENARITGPFAHPPGIRELMP